ncbi:MAG TPA: hypothetical protein VMA97_10195 [Streptosporangiaceae bacterium]|nr:hypothetical protein [Streptosporangiaceae bacterium]
MPSWIDHGGEVVWEPAPSLIARVGDRDEVPQVPQFQTLLAVANVSLHRLRGQI